MTLSCLSQYAVERLKGVYCLLAGTDTQRDMEKTK